MKAILDIPDASLLATSSLDELVDHFCLKSGVSHPDVICLPLWDEGGAQFDSAYTSSENSLWQRYRLESELARIRDHFPSTQIYLSVIPLPGVKSGHLTCRDQFGNEKARVCIVNPHTQSLINKVIHEAASRFVPDGIMLDVVNIHPQGADDSRKYVEITCFCEHCRNLMDEMKYDADAFRKLESPLSLALRASQTGISYITPKSTQDPDEIVQEAVRRGYIPSTDEAKYQAWAQAIVRYVQIRTKITGSAVGKIRKRIKQDFPNMNVGTILNTNSFDWTGGSDLRGLVGQIDEAWLDVDDLTDQTAPSGIEIYAYTVDRSRYRVDAFFSYASDRTLIETALGSLKQTVESLLETMRERAVRVDTANNLDKAVVNSFSEMSFVKGFVGIPFDKSIYQTILQAIRKEATLIVDATEQDENIPLDKFRQYMVNLVQLAEQGRTLGRQEIIGVAAQMELID